MKKIIESRKLLGVDKEVQLSELKSIYRTFMKDWHPDKFQDGTWKNWPLKRRARQ
jgi:DnaJ-class molecular chaperone